VDPGHRHGLIQQPVLLGRRGTLIPLALLDRVSRRLARPPSPHGWIR
jgi:hypothetical protein